MNSSKSKIIVFLLGLVLAPLLSFGQNNLDTKKLDSLLDQLSAKNKFMGSLTISKNDQLLYNKAYGFSFVNGKEKRKATTETKYRIGSITKMFTSVMIFQLIEEKKLSLDTKLAEYFLEIPNANTITISNLMNHRSGIHNLTDDSTYLDWNTKLQTEEEMVAKIISHAPDFAANEKTAYSNSNYVLLGYIIEKITKKDYASNLKERITNKIGLKNTYYGGKTDLNANESYSYSFVDGKWIQEAVTDMSVPHGAGAIVATTNDLTKFITALFQGKLISKSSLDSMTSLTDHFGRGIFSLPFYEKNAFGHTGGIDKFTSALSYFSDDSMAIAFCTNGLDYNMNDIALGVLSIYYNKPYEIPSLKEIHIDPEFLKKYDGVYSSKEIPIKLTVKSEGNKLTAQATGQSPFPLKPVSETEFTFAAAKISIEFNKEKNELILKQNGAKYIMSKE